jgi:hypothetical protein
VKASGAGYAAENGRWAVTVACLGLHLMVSGLVMNLAFVLHSCKVRILLFDLMKHCIHLQYIQKSTSYLAVNRLLVVTKNICLVWLSEVIAFIVEHLAKHINTLHIKMQSL